MDIREGDRVIVNLAPFIGARARSKHSVPCRVTAVDGDQVQVTTEHPYRTVALWVSPAWIEAEHPDLSEEDLAASLS